MSSAELQATFLVSHQWNSRGSPRFYGNPAPNSQTWQYRMMKICGNSIGSKTVTKRHSRLYPNNRICVTYTQRLRAVRRVSSIVSLAPSDHMHMADQSQRRAVVHITSVADRRHYDIELAVQTTPS